MSARRQPPMRRNRGDDASGALASAPASPTMVQFSVVEIREFERVVGDNPSCSSGVPVSIGWNHGKTLKMDLEAFERARPPRRSQMDLVLTRGERHRLLVEWGASGQDVIEAIRMIIRVKNQRRQTVNNLGTYDRIEEIFENLSRRMKRVICQSSSQTAAIKLHHEPERVVSTKGRRKNRQKTLSSGEAASDTANETATAASLSKRGRGHNSKSSERDSKPPCTEVSVMKNGSDHSTNSAAADMATPEMKMPQRPEMSYAAQPAAGMKQLIEAKQDDRDDTYKHETDNDMDNMSNPQSHDHRDVSTKAPRPIQTPVESIDI